MMTFESSLMAQHAPIAVSVPQLSGADLNGRLRNVGRSPNRSSLLTANSENSRKAGSYRANLILQPFS